MHGPGGLVYLIADTAVSATNGVGARRRSFLGFFAAIQLFPFYQIVNIQQRGAENKISDPILHRGSFKRSS